MARQLSHLAPPADRPTLTWPGRDDCRVVLTDDEGGVRRVPRDELPLYRLVEQARGGDGSGLLIHGENYHALAALRREGYEGRIKLVYIDPPFNTGRRFEHYHDLLGPGLYLEMLRDRLVLLRELLAPDGSIVVHLDDRAVHHVRLLMDDIYGAENFRNSVVVKRVTKNLQRQFRQVQALPQAHDTCLLYSREPTTRYPLPLVARPGGPRHPKGYWKDFWSTADRPTMRYELLGVQPIRGQWKWCAARALAAVDNHRRYEREGNGRSLVRFWRDHGETMEFIRRGASGRVCHWIPPGDMLCADTLWTDFSAYSFRQGFPTEKSERLLGRIVGLFSEPGDLLLDCFAGSGTLGAVAARMERRWIMVERGEQTITHIVPRLAACQAGYRLCHLEALNDGREAPCS